MLMCSERSGSNLISRMMGAHPEICSPAPSHLIRILAENRCRYGDLHRDVEWERLLQDAVDLLRTQLGSWRRTWTLPDLLQTVPQRSLVALVRHLFFAEAEASGCSRLFIKENHIYRYLPFLQRAFTGMQIIYLVRDPRDMALSWKNSSVLRGDVVRATRIWQEDQCRGLQVMGYLESGVDLHQLSYEDLVSEPTAQLEQVCDVLHVRPDPAMLEFHRDGDAISASTRTGDWENLEKPLMKANFGKYRTGLAPNEIALVETVCGDVMDVFGYVREIDEPPTLAALEAELLPRERREKPGWAQVSAAEKELRRARAEVMTRITSHVRQRPVQPRIQHV